MASSPPSPAALGPHSTRWPRTGWRVSQVGFGGYRIARGEDEHAQALALALQSGCNLIDTSTNYTDGRSESLIGEVLRDQFKRGNLKRDEVVIVTKAGYVQGANLELAREREAEGRGFGEMVRYSPNCWHCISPEFLDDQINRSRERLGIECIDLLLLHNPEYYLKTEADHAEYYRRIRAAFEFLEGAAAEGRIAAYGVSSNSLGDPKESGEFTSLVMLERLANEAALESASETVGEGVAGEKHDGAVRSRFVAVQFPFNLFEPGALLEPNNDGQSVIDYARAQGFATLINRPLNAIVGQRLVRLADFSDAMITPISAAQIRAAAAKSGHLDSLDLAVEELKQALSGALSVEAKYPAREAPADLQIRDVAWAHVLRENLSRVTELDAWQSILTQQIEPAFRQTLKRLRDPELSRAIREWSPLYERAETRLFRAFSAFLTVQAAELSHRISAYLFEAAAEARLNDALTALKAAPTLSRRAVLTYQSIPGISTVLVGMRNRRYVQDLLPGDPTLEAETARRLLESFLKRADKIIESSPPASSASSASSATGGPGAGAGPRAER